MGDKVAENKKRQVKKAETVRERSARSSAQPEKNAKAKRVVRAAKKPISNVTKASKKEYHPIKLPNNKVGKFLNKRARIMPRYFTNAWAEIKQVKWPNRKDTTRMTISVISFAVVFGGVVFVLDYGLDILFKQILLG